MMLEIDDRSPTPVYQQIVLQIRGAIAGGALSRGAPLPPIRQLAIDLEVNPATVAKAYQMLERDGIIRTAGRRGTFVHADAGPNLEDSLRKEAAQQARDLAQKWLERGLAHRDLKAIFTRILNDNLKETSP
jgi:GntR family transcriptional regulator